MRLKAHVGYVYTEPGHLPRKVLFLSYAKHGQCRVVDYAAKGSAYCTVARDRIGEEWDPWFARWRKEHPPRPELNFS